MNTLIELEEQYVAHNYHPLPVVIAKGEGVWVWDTEGKKYLDMISAYSALNHGHCHPRLVKALQDQASLLALTSRAVYSNKLGVFLEKLCEVAQMDLAAPMNSGAEAVETAIKAARLWGYKVKKIPANKAEIIVAQDNFHGRTTTIVSFSSEPLYKNFFGPHTPGFVTVPFGSSKALEDAITPNTCALLIEPMQGEGGIKIPPKGYLAQAHRICKKNNVLLIVDEIQTGLGRTGKTFAFEHDNIIPDGVIVGKALGGGLLPVSAFLSKKEVLELFTPGSHGSTFGGNPLAAAVGLEALQVMKDEQLVHKSEKLGMYFMESLQKLKTPWIKEIRGKGLWVGVEVDPKKANVRSICEKLLQKGILAKDTREVVIRFVPPLIITKEEIDWAVAQIKSAFEETHPVHQVA